MHTITGNAIKAGVIGYPIAHSLSPRLHGYWLNLYNIDGVYIPLAVAPDKLKTAVRSIADMGFAGINITVPHKETILDCADEIDSLAKRIGAANTLIIKEGKIKATNTDAYGFIENIKSKQTARPNIKGITESALVIGAGGAARAICVALQEAGAKRIILVNRTQANAEKIAADLAQFGKDIIEVIPSEKSNQIMAEVDLVVNTSTLGMIGYPKLEISLAALTKNSIVNDIVYKPLDTDLLQQATKLGHQAIDGIGMLLHQAVAGFEAWFGIKPEVTKELEKYVLAAVK